MTLRAAYARDRSTDGRTDGLTEKVVTVTSQIQLDDARTHGRERRFDVETCTDHGLECLTEAEYEAFGVADSLADSPESYVRGLLVRRLMATIERLEHELAHARWGGLECDQRELYPDVVPDRSQWQAWRPTLSAATPEPEPAPAFIYRFYDHCGCLLYVGITNDFQTRRAAHAKDSPWHALAKTFTVLEMASRDNAAAAELHAIDTESPAFNSAGRTSRATAERVTAYLLSHAKG